MGGVTELRLLRAGTGAEAERSAGGFRVDGEPEWLVEGPSALLDEVLLALPRGLGEKWGSSIRLRFGNTVGRILAGPLGVLEVRSGKWTEAEYERMLGDVASNAAALAYASSGRGSHAYVRDTSLALLDLPYHAFLFLRHTLLDAPDRPLLGALRAIVKDPHRRLTHYEAEVPVELAARVTPRTIDDAIAGRWPMQRIARARGFRGLAPLTIAEPRVRESVDTAENRFVKAFLDGCLQVVASVTKRAEQAPSSIRLRLSDDARALEDALSSIRRSSLWRAVGRLAQMPTGSVVLQRRAPYREVLRCSTLLTAGSKLLPLSSEEVVNLLAMKDVAKLYEVWCGFQLLALLRKICGESSSVTPSERGTFDAKVPWGLHATWSSGVELAINPAYTKTTGWHGTSRSVQLRPDYALRIVRDGVSSLHFFDAKFRLVSEAGKASEGKVEDLHKMHTYRDAIPSAVGSWVMYPGELSEQHFDDGGESRGVGFFPAAPGVEHTALEGFLRRLAHRAGPTSG